MARPHRNNVDYFPFYCGEGKKMFYLEETYGNNGFAVFLKLLRELANADYHYLDLSNEKTIMFLSAKCKVSKDLLLSIITDLSTLEKFDKELWNDNKIIWCQDFIDSIQDAYKKRINECINREELITILEGLGIRKPSKKMNKPSNFGINAKIKKEKSKEDSFIETQILEIFYFKNFTAPLKEVEAFCNHYEGEGWRTGNGNSITNKVSIAKRWRQKPLLDNNKRTITLTTPILLTKWKDFYEASRDVLSPSELEAFLYVVPEYHPKDNNVIRLQAESNIAIDTLRDIWSKHKLNKYFNVAVGNVRTEPFIKKNLL